MITSNKVDIDIDVPKERMDIFSADRKSYILWRDSNYEMIEKNENGKESCTSNKALGLSLCLKQSFDNYIPFIGSFDASISLKKEDTFNKVIVYASLESGRVELLIDTPNSQMNRKINALFTSTNGKQYKIVASAPYQNSVASISADLNLVTKSLKADYKLGSAVWEIIAEDRMVQEKHHPSIVIRQQGAQDKTINMVYANSFSQGTYLKISHVNILKNSGSSLLIYKRIGNDIVLDAQNEYGQDVNKIYAAVELPTEKIWNGKFDVKVSKNSEVIILKNRVQDNSKAGDLNLAIESSLKTSRLDIKFANNIIRNNQNSQLNVVATYGPEKTSMMLKIKNNDNSAVIDRTVDAKIIHTQHNINHSLKIKATRLMQTPRTTVFELTLAKLQNNIVTLKYNSNSPSRTEMNSDLSYTYYNTEYIRMINKFQLNKPIYNADITWLVLDNKFILNAKYDVSNSNKHEFEGIFKNPYTKDMTISGFTGTNLSKFNGKLNVNLWDWDFATEGQWNLKFGKNYMIDGKIQTSSPWHAASISGQLNRQNDKFDNVLRMKLNKWLSSVIELVVETDRSNPKVQYKHSINNFEVDFNGQVVKNVNENTIKFTLKTPLMEYLKVLSQNVRDSNARKMTSLTKIQYGSEIVELQGSLENKMHGSIIGNLELTTPMQMLKIAKLNLDTDVKHDGRYEATLAGQLNNMKHSVNSVGVFMLTTPLNIQTTTTVLTNDQQEYKLYINHECKNNQMISMISREFNGKRVYKLSNTITKSLNKPTFNLKLIVGEKSSELDFFANIDNTDGFQKLEAQTKFSSDLVINKNILFKTNLENGNTRKYFKLDHKYTNGKEMKLIFERKIVNDEIRGVASLEWPHENSPINMDWTVKNDDDEITVSANAKNPKFNHGLTFSTKFLENLVSSEMKYNADEQVASYSFSHEFRRNNLDSNQELTLVLNKQKIEMKNRINVEQKSFTWENSMDAPFISYKIESSNKHGDVYYKNMMNTLAVVVNGEISNIDNELNVNSNGMTVKTNIRSKAINAHMVMDNTVTKGKVNFFNTLNLNNNKYEFSNAWTYAGIYELDGEFRLVLPTENFRYELKQAKSGNILSHVAKAIYNENDVSVNAKIDTSSNKKFTFTLNSEKFPEINVDMKTTYSGSYNNFRVSGDVSNDKLGKFNMQASCKSNSLKNYDITITLSSNKLQNFEISAKHESEGPMKSNMNSKVKYGEAEYVYNHDYELSDLLNLRKAVLKFSSPNGEHIINGNYAMTHNYPESSQHKTEWFYNSPNGKSSIDFQHNFDSKSTNANMKTEILGKKLEYNHEINMASWSEMQKLNINVNTPQGEWIIQESHKIGQNSKVTFMFNSPKTTVFSTDSTLKISNYLKHELDIEFTVMNEKYGIQQSLDISPDLLQGVHKITLNSMNKLYTYTSDYKLETMKFYFDIQVLRSSEKLMQIHLTHTSDKSIENFSDFPVTRTNKAIFAWMKSVYDVEVVAKMINAWNLESSKVQVNFNGITFNQQLRYNLGLNRVEVEHIIDGTATEYIKILIDGNRNKDRSVYSSDLTASLRIAKSLYSYGLELKKDHSKIQTFKQTIHTPSGRYIVSMSGDKSKGELLIETPISGYERNELNFEHTFTSSGVFGNVNTNFQAFTPNMKIEFNHQLELSSLNNIKYNLNLVAPIVENLKVNFNNQNSLSEVTTNIVIELPSGKWVLDNEINHQLPAIPQLTWTLNVATPIEDFEEMSIEMTHHGFPSKIDTDFNITWMGKVHKVGVHYDLSVAKGMFSLDDLSLQFKCIYQKGKDLVSEIIVATPVKYGYHFQSTLTGDKLVNSGFIIFKNVEHKANSYIEYESGTLKTGVDINEDFKFASATSGNVHDFTQEIYYSYRGEVAETLQVYKYGGVGNSILSYKANWTHPIHTGGKQEQFSFVLKTAPVAGGKTAFTTDILFRGKTYHREVVWNNSAEGFTIEAEMDQPRYSMRINHQYAPIDMQITLTTPKNVEYSFSAQLEVNDRIVKANFMANHPAKSGISFELEKQKNTLKLHGNCFIENRNLPFSMNYENNESKCILKFSFTMLSLNFEHTKLVNGFKNTLDATYTDHSMKMNSGYSKNDRKVEAFFEMKNPTKVFLKINKNGDLRDFEINVESVIPWNKLPELKASTKFQKSKNGFNGHVKGTWHNEEHGLSLNHESINGLMNTEGTLLHHGVEYISNLEHKYRSANDYDTTFIHKYGNKEAKISLYNRINGGYFGQKHGYSNGLEINTECNFLKNFKFELTSSQTENSYKGNVNVKINKFNADLTIKKISNIFELVMNNPHPIELKINVQRNWPTLEITGHFKTKAIETSALLFIIKNEQFKLVITPVNQPQIMIQLKNTRNENKWTGTATAKFQKVDYELVLTTEKNSFEIEMKKPKQIKLSAIIVKQWPNMEISVKYNIEAKTGEATIKAVKNQQYSLKYDGQHMKNMNIDVRSNFQQDANSLKHTGSIEYEYSNNKDRMSHNLQMNRDAEGEYRITLDVQYPEWNNPEITITGILKENIKRSSIKVLAGEHVFNMYGNIEANRISWTLKYPHFNLDDKFTLETMENMKSGEMSFKHLTMHNKIVEYFTKYELNLLKNTFKVKSIVPNHQFQITASQKQTVVSQQMFQVTIDLDDEPMVLQIEHNAKANFLKAMYNFAKHELRASASYEQKQDEVNFKIEHEHNGMINKDGHFKVYLASQNVAFFDTKWNPSTKKQVVKTLKSFEQKFLSVFDERLNALQTEITARQKQISDECAPLLEKLNTMYENDVFYTKSSCAFVSEICQQVNVLIKKFNNCTAKYVNIVAEKISIVYNSVSYAYAMTCEVIVDHYSNVSEQISNIRGGLETAVIDFITYTTETLKNHPWTRNIYEKLTNMETYRTIYRNALKFSQKYYQTFYEHPIWSKLINHANNVAQKIDLYERLTKIHEKIPVQIRKVMTKSFNRMQSALRDSLNDFAKLDQTRFNTYEPEAGAVSFQIYSPFAMVNLHTIPSVMPKMRQFIGKLANKLVGVLPDDKLPDFGLIYDLYYSFRPTSINPIEYMPPRNAHATIGKHFIRTFDNKIYDFNDRCSYVLVKDVSTKRFAVFADYSTDKKIITVVVGQLQVTIQGYRVRVNEVEKELPISEFGNIIERKADSIVLTNVERGLTVDCILSTERCTVSISGWYFGKTAGLMGTYDNEQYTDLIKSDNTIAANEKEMIESWALDKTQCMQKSTHTALEQLANIKTCENLFTDYSSSFRACYSQVDVEPFLKMCKYSENTCQVADFYRQECSEMGVNVNLPNHCILCDASSKLLKSGESMEINENNKIDVVFVFEKCNRNLDVFQTLSQLAQAIVSNYEGMDVNFGMVGFNGEQLNGAFIQTADNGKILVEAEHVKKFTQNDLSYSVGKQSDIKEAIVVASSKFPYRFGSTKSIVVIPCSSCASSQFELFRLNSLLERQDIHLHMLIDENFKVLKGKGKFGHVFGVDHNRMYTNRQKELQLHQDQRQFVYKPQDKCVALAELNQGTIFTLKLLKGENPLQKTYFQAFGSAIQNTATQRNCQQCECRQVNGVAYSHCQRCNRPSLYTMIWN